MYLRKLQCLTCAFLLRNAWSKESSRHKLKVHSPDETEEIQKVLEIAELGQEESSVKQEIATFHLAGERYYL